MWRRPSSVLSMELIEWIQFFVLLGASIFFVPVYSGDIVYVCRNERVHKHSARP